MALHSTTVSWRRRGMVLLAAASTTLGLAVVVSPAAEADKPPPTGELKITMAKDNGTTLPPISSPKDVVVGFVKPGEPFTLEVQSLVYGTDTALLVDKDTAVTVSAGSTSWTVTIPEGDSVGTKDDALWGSTSNFLATASAKFYASDTLPVTVGVNSKNEPNNGNFQSLDNCILTKDNPTCVQLSVSGGSGGAATLLSTSLCANFLGGETTGLTCRSAKGATAMVAQTFVDLAPGQVATAILDCAKTLCGQGGVGQFVPLVDKGNIGAFSTPPDCPGRGDLGDLGVCYDKQQSNRDNAGITHSYILFDYDLRMSH